MPRSAPYLQRRGHQYFFRIAVPNDLRPALGWREVTRTLRTSDRKLAVPLALEYAARAKRTFATLRAEMASNNNYSDEFLSEVLSDVEEEERQRVKQVNDRKLQEIVAEAKTKLQLEELAERYEAELDHQRATFHAQLKQANLEAQNNALKAAIAVQRYAPSPSPILQGENSLQPLPDASIPKLKDVVDRFLDKYQQDKKPAMFKKHKPVLSMLLDVVGNKPITALRQADLNDFFDLLGLLPPRWADECRKRSLSIRELAELEFDITIGPKTFEDTYIASIRPFLKAAKKDWQDQGFPLGLTTEGIEYTGDREEDESKQRALKPGELARLFQGPEMNAFASSPETAQYFWLPHIGLFTGARVNEICQINPQSDVLQDEATGIWYLWITTETPADPRVRKSVKTGEARKVPIHKKLIELGFLSYVERIKRNGAKLLFPQWQPINRRASGAAEKWFRQLLRDLNLRDEPPKAKVLGMHIFRHTLLTYGGRQKPPISLFCITGHSQGDTPIDAQGAGKGYLTMELIRPIEDKKALLDQLDYGLAFHKPADVRT